MNEDAGLKDDWAALGWQGSAWDIEPSPLGVAQAATIVAMTNTAVIDVILVFFMGNLYSCRNQRVIRKASPAFCVK